MVQEGCESKLLTNYTRVQQGRFESQAVDLNQVRRNFHEAQRTMAANRPVDPNLAVGVTPTGDIIVGNDVEATPGATRVQQGTFAAAMTPAARADHERKVAGSRLPANVISHDGGWSYTFETQFGNEYTIFTKWGGICYQSWLIKPEIEGGVGAHSGHLYPDGRLCLSDAPGSGQSTLEEAFAKSVIWANGVDVVRQGWDFPFSINNLRDGAE